LSPPSRATRIFLLFLLMLAVLATEPQAQSGSDPGQAPDDVSQCPVTNVFYDSDLREILQTIAAQCFVNVVADETVSGLITVEFEDVPLEEAMRRILGPFGLTYRWMDGYYLIGSPHPANPSFPFLTETELYRPNFVKAADIPKLISTYYTPFMRINEQTNTIALTASPELLERLKADLARVDRPSRQIMIEALVTEISEDNLKEVGIGVFVGGTKENREGVINLPLSSISDSALVVTGTKLDDVWGSWSVNYQAAVKALVSDGKADIRANPRLATKEGQKARIFIGEDQYHTIATGSETYYYTRLEVIKVGISLEVTPYVSEAGEITVELAAIVSDVTGMGATGLPLVNTRDVSTKITVTDGESIVIGGLQSDITRKTVKKVPLLGDIPILGHLFRNTSTEINKSQIVIVITPHLIGD
jgi:type II secretory pathway component GspD/PulD (secretin)